MSGIQLSNTLSAEIKAIVEKHDDSASDDMLYMQYLSAVMGYVLAHQNYAENDAKELLNDLTGFTGQVYQQVKRDLVAQESQPPQEDAFGVWKPGQ